MLNCRLGVPHAVTEFPMKNQRVTWVAVGVLLAVAAVAYYLTNWKSGGPAVAGVKGESKDAATAGGKAGAKAAAKGGKK